MRGDLIEEVSSSICLKPEPRRSHSWAHIYFNRGQGRGRQKGKKVWIRMERKGKKSAWGN